MKIKYKKAFLKNYQKRIKSNKNLVKKFNERLLTFADNPSDSQLRNHRLTGGMNDYFSFSITGDIRVVYRIIDNIVYFYDVGSHNQVYK